MPVKCYAKIENNIVVESTRCEGDDVRVPDGYLELTEDVWVNVPAGSRQSSDGTFVPPPKSRVITKFVFLRLLTPTEYAAMFGQQSDPMLAYGVAMFNAAPDPFNIDDPLVAQMLDYCVSVGALTAARRAELWAAMEAAA